MATARVRREQTVEETKCADAEASTFSIQRAISFVEIELQKGLSAFQLSTTQEISGGVDDEDDSSIASEVDNLPCFEETVRRDLHQVKDWGYCGQVATRCEKPIFSVPNLVATFSDDSASTETTHDSFSEIDDETSTSASLVKSSLLEYLGQSSGFGRMSLALASDMAASQTLDQSYSPILLPWLRNQIQFGMPWITSDGEWLFRAPLMLGSISSARDGLPNVLPEMCNLLQPEGIQEIEEEEEEALVMLTARQF